MIVYLPAMFACVAGAGLLAEDELVLALVLWLDGVDVLELLDDLQPITATTKTMKAIACVRRCRFIMNSPR